MLVGGRYMLERVRERGDRGRDEGRQDKEWKESFTRRELCGPDAHLFFCISNRICLWNNFWHSSPLNLDRPDSESTWARESNCRVHIIISLYHMWSHLLTCMTHSSITFNMTRYLSMLLQHSFFFNYLPHKIFASPKYMLLTMIPPLWGALSFG